MKTEKLAQWVAAWPEERTAARLERCRSMLAACGMLDHKTSCRISARIKRMPAPRTRRAPPAHTGTRIDKNPDISKDAH